MACAARPVAAQIETVGPLSITQGQPVDLFYTNDLEPAPHRKVLQFSGLADNPTSVDASLEMQFDYIDLNGITQFISLPNSPFTIPAGAVGAPIEGIHILDFCPEQVSLHFDLLEGEAINLSGEFAHNCITVPETTSASLVSLAGGLLVVMTRRQRNRTRA
ncbi:MAG: hypothetical protein CMJ58_23890 [Planctomycetaceae bacterium]|nr:hypothetical protein [Planctomycetaceae bacterium]